MKAQTKLLKFTQRIALLILSALLVACGKTLTLTPELVGQDCVGFSDANYTCSPLPGSCRPKGSGCIAPNPEGFFARNTLATWTGDQIYVGWDDSYDAGTQPCACEQWSSGNHNAYFRFDITPIKDKEITAAALTWNRAALGGSQENDQSRSCYRRALFTADQSWRLDTAAAFAVSLSGQSDNSLLPKAEFVGVNELVQSWADGADNDGFMLKPVRQVTKERSNESCLNTLSDIQLMVRYRDKKWGG